MTDVDTSEAERPGIDRRTIIKRAAAAGAVAWTAPAILGSIASPAGAITGTPGCFKFTVPINTGAACNNVTAAFDTTCDFTTTQCSPTTEAAGVALSKYCMAASTACAATTGTVTFTINAGCGCTFLAARGETNNNVACGGQCLNGVIAAGNKSVTFTKPGGACQWLSWNFIVQCT
jgi:hypothetical protein